MKKLVSILTLGAVVAFGAGIAGASECPLLIKQLREAKVSDPAKAAEVKKLTDEAEDLHKAGKHADSVKKAGEAAQAAGIQLQHKK